MGVMEAIRKGFGVTAKAISLVVVLFIFNLIFNLASIPLAPKPGAPAPAQISAAALILSIIFILASIFFQGGALGCVSDVIKKAKAALGDFAGYGAKYYLRLLALGLLIVLIIAIIGLVAALLIAATIPLNNTAVTVVASVIAVAIGIVGLYFILLLVFAPYVIVCENVGTIEALKKSMKVVKRVIWKVVLILILLILISLGIGFVIGFLTGLVTAAMPAIVGQILIGIVNSAVNGYLGIVMMASFMSFYLGLEAKDKEVTGKVF